MANRALLLKRQAELLKSVRHLNGEIPPGDSGETYDFLKEELRQSTRLNSIRLVEAKIYRHTLYRSPKRHEKYPLKGYTGYMILDNVSAGYYKLLKLGEYIHVGSNTSVGFGKIQVSPV